MQFREIAGEAKQHAWLTLPAQTRVQTIKSLTILSP